MQNISYAFQQNMYKYIVTISPSHFHKNNVEDKWLQINQTYKRLPKYKATQVASVYTPTLLPWQQLTMCHRKSLQ